MKTRILTAGLTLATALLAACAEFRDEGKCDPIDADPSVAARLEGEWNLERTVFRNGEQAAAQSGVATGRMLGRTAIVRAQDAGVELVFGIRQDGEYALIDIRGDRDEILVGKDDDEDDEDECELEDDSRKDANGEAIRFEFGKKVYATVRFAKDGNSVEILRWTKRGDHRIPQDRILLNRIR